MQTMGGPKGGDFGFLRTKDGASTQPKPPKQLTPEEVEFMSRMDFDVEDRRRTAFITQLRKDPRFRPSMLEGPKPKFQTVTLTGGPIVKQHKPNKTGMETRRPYQWGPLGGYY